MRLAEFEALPEHAQRVFERMVNSLAEAETLLNAHDWVLSGCDGSPDDPARLLTCDRLMQRVDEILRLWGSWWSPLLGHDGYRRHPWGPRPHLAGERETWRRRCAPLAAEHERTMRERIEAFKRHHQLEDVIGRTVELHGRGARLSGCCPLHGDTRPSLVVYVEQQRWWCYGACATGGDVLDWLRLTDQATYRQVMQGA